MNARRNLAAAIVAAIVIVAGCSSSTLATAGPVSGFAGPAGQPTRTSEGGEVTVVVDWAGPSAGTVFDVTLDTHSVDLDPLDLADAVLRNDRGETLKPRPWAAPKGGHHRQGTLAFEGDADRFLADARWVELVVKGVGELPERSLRWELRS